MDPPATSAGVVPLLISQRTSLTARLIRIGSTQIQPLFSYGGFVLGKDVEGAVGVDAEADSDLGHAAGRCPNLPSKIEKKSR